MKATMALGPYVLGRIDQIGVTQKFITEKSRVHPSTFSRFINGIKPISERQLLEIGIAIGEANAQQKATSPHTKK